MPAKTWCELVFGIPGAKVDSIFEALRKVQSQIRLVVCRHEQNAAFMAAIYGRLTGKPGVVLVTSGPGVTNLATGLLTATTEGDPVIAIGANVPRMMLAKHAHQRLDNALSMEAVCKQSLEVVSTDAIAEVVSGAFRLATQGHQGAVFLSFPQDVLLEQTSIASFVQHSVLEYSGAPAHLCEKAALLINSANFPVILLGQNASTPAIVKSLHHLLSHSKIPTVCTFQAAGCVPKHLSECFLGTAGLFSNQVGDRALSEADVVVCIGYDPVEYGSELWNKEPHKRKIIHIDLEPAELRNTFVPAIELLGNMALTLSELALKISVDIKPEFKTKILKLQKSLFDKIDSGKLYKGPLVHPMRFIYELNRCIDSKTIVVSDIGTHYMWLARYFLSYEPRHLLFSNGQQTLGVALPWAAAASMINPDKKIVSVSGDGGFLCSSMELETAVREKCKFVHCVWRDGTFNMVAEQQSQKYKNNYGVNFNKIDLVKYAESFGAKGYCVEDSDNLYSVLQTALLQEGPVLVDIPIDYSENAALFAAAYADDLTG